MTELNEYDIIIGDIYCALIDKNYYFFQVTDTEEIGVKIRELEIENYEDGVKISLPIRKAKKPKIVRLDATIFPVKLERDYWLPINYNGFTYYAVKLKEYLNKFWSTDELWNETNIALA